MFSSSIIDAMKSTKEQRERKQRERMPIREEFIAKGCDPHALDFLLREYCRVCKNKRSQKEEARSTIEELNDLHDRLNEIASKIEKLQARHLDFLCGQTLCGQTVTRSALKKAAAPGDRVHRSTVWRSRPGLIPNPLNTTVGRSEADKLKTVWRAGADPILSPLNTTLVRSEAEKLKKAADHVDRAVRSTVWRRDARADVIAKLYAYCCYVPGEDNKVRAITHIDVANLLTEYEFEEMGINNRAKPVSEVAVKKNVWRGFSRRKLKLRS
jgi:hypothetical protein